MATLSPRVDVIYARYLHAGDWYAGKINPDAPTTPVQPVAAAPHLTAVTDFTSDDGMFSLALKAGDLDLEPVTGHTRCLVIRGLA